MPIHEPISTTIWDMKYRYYLNGVAVDHTIEDTWRRVASAIASAEKKKEQAHWQKEFYHILENYQFLPGGRILAGAGTQHKVTLLNCFVMNMAEDSLQGIFRALEEGALTLQAGGGVGYDFSVLRPSGELAKATGVPSSGPVSFMRIWDTMCSVMLSTGARRGAMMGVLRCDHPDIEAFITAKADAKELRHFNVSVMVSDAFMQAVKHNEEWPLVFPANDLDGDIVHRQWGNSLTPIPCRVYKRINARKLWDSIIRNAYDHAEPGVLFSDTINRLNNLFYCERINATNPCGEIPLQPYGACDLGAINLTQFVRQAFSGDANIDWRDFEETTRIATRFLDNVLDVSHYPLQAQREQAHGTRRIGLGITGLADMFVMLGIKYGSDKSIALTQEIMRRLAEVTWQTSIELAREKGVFPFYQKDYLRSKFVQTLPAALQTSLAKFGVRNSHHNTIAPTGTISLLANNVSNGIEPIFQAEYERHVKLADNETMTTRVKDYAYHCWLHEHHQEKLPPAWMDTASLEPLAHLQIQAAAQPYVDNAISKTINIPIDFPFDAVKNIYTQAYELGLKGCTIFRPNPVTGNVLQTSTTSSKIQEEPCCQRD